MKSKTLKVYYIRNESYETFCVKHLDKIVNADIVLFAPDIISEIDYDNELEQRSFIFKEMANLSLKLNCIVCAGLKTKLASKSYDSIVCVEKGKILGICDSVLSGEKNLGAEFNIYETQIGLVGVACYKDADFFEALKLLKLFGAEIVVNIDFELTEIKKLNFSYYYQRENLRAISLCKNAFYISGQDAVQDDSFDYQSVDFKEYKNRIMADNKNIYKIIAEKL